jgi:hypothetical protein
MKHYQLHPEWQMDLPDEFEKRKEDEHLIFWKPGMTILTTVFAYSGEGQRKTLLANLRARAEAEKLETVEDQTGDLVLFGYMQPEQIQPGHQRLALHAFTTARYGCLQTSFYLDQQSDLREALLIWKSVQHITPPAEE